MNQVRRESHPSRMNYIKREEPVKVNESPSVREPSYLSEKRQMSDNMEKQDK